MNGYPTDKPCEVCGDRPATIEPRFGYIVCELHSAMPPIQVSRLIKYAKDDRSILVNRKERER